MNRVEGLNIQLIDANRQTAPVANVIVDVAFFVERRQCYQFYAGRSDLNGRIEARFDYFDHERRSNATENLMDYNIKIEDCDSQVQLHIPSLDELLSRLQAVKKWYPQCAHALVNRLTGCTNGIVNADDVTVELERGTMTNVKLTCRVK
jgi:hypothetical protein